mmetsp:Transcript_9776/g.19187  ORF Transcript_9776/g.19187 Transcript_9776/m.19187 type:complete len:304 (-) Transcript_9776:346-1257(-)
MSGPRTIADLNRERENDQRGRLGAAAQPQSSDAAPLLGYGAVMGTPEEARREKFWDMLKFTFCPLFRLQSFIFLITIVDIIYFFISVGYHNDPDKFLTPSLKSLDDLGAKDAYRLKHDVQLWRWFTPMLLHVNMFHITSNMIMQMILGFRLEPTVGVWRTIIVYISSAIGGVLFSCLVSPDTLAVGASTSIFGIIGAMLCWIIMNWSSLGDSPGKIFTVIWLVMLLVFNIIIGFSSEHTDNWGHFGGFITGFCIAPLVTQFLAQASPQQKKAWRLACGGTLAVYVILGFTLFYTDVHTEKHDY